MNKILRTGLGAVIIVVIPWLRFYQSGVASYARPSDQAPASAGQIHDATVLIKMLLPVSEEAGKEVDVLERGMGTLVAIDGQNYLITHNHWGTVLQEWTIVELYDSSNHLLKLMLGYEFIGLISYQDEGTLILRSPQDLETKLIPAAVGDPSGVQPGEIAHISYRWAPDREKAGLLEARVDEVFDHGGVPAYRLRSLSGQPIQRGDSGGGVWHDGKYVGNMWVTIVAVTVVGDPAGSGSQPTDTSYAAVYPANWLFQQVPETEYGNHPMPTIENGTTLNAGIE